MTGGSVSETIRGVRIHEHGGLEQVVVDELQAPRPGPGEVRVRVLAAALNHLDLFVLEGIPGLEMPLPHVMGADGAGVIDAVGEGVEDWSPGDEVVINPGLFCGRCEFCLDGEQSMCTTYSLLGEHLDGTFAEAVVVPARNCHCKPTRLDWRAAAAFPLVTLTAWRMVVTHGKVGPGTTVLIHGIGGGVSLVALQIAVAAGASVWVTSSSDDKLARARELGAVGGWNYREVESVGREIRGVTDKRGVDLVIDNVGKATFAESIEAARKGGTIVTCGVTTGPALPVDGRRVFWKHLRIQGSTMGNEADFQSMLRAVAAGRIEPVIDRVLPLSDAAEALRLLQAGEQMGKIVLDVAGDS